MKTCWIVTVHGKRFAMVGEKCSYEDALAYARGIWESAEVE